MQKQIRIVYILVCFILFLNKVDVFAYPILVQEKVEDIILKQRANQNQTLQNSIDSYKEVLSENHHSTDSIEIFKIIALSSSKLGNSYEAVLYIEKYIKNSLNTSILNSDTFNKIKKTDEFKGLEDRYLPKINILIFLYFYIAFLGFFIAVIMNFRKKSDKTAARLISSFIVIHSLFIIEFCFFLSNYRLKYPHTFLMSSAPSLLYGPLLYLYFKRITKGYILKKIDLLHLLPMAFMIVVLYPAYSLNSVEKLKILFGTSNLYSINSFFYLVFIPKAISIFVYGIFVGKLHFENSKKDKKNNNPQFLIWARNIYRIHVIYLLSYVIYGLSVSSIFIVVPDFIYHSQVVAMSLMVLYIAQIAYLQPKIFNGEVSRFRLTKFSFKYKKSGLTKSLSVELKESLIKLLEEDKIYKNNSLNLNQLSEILGTTRHNTSQIINEHFNVNFFELLNRYRINEAINIFRQDVNGNLNIIDVAYEVGYNNKVTFNKAFKKETSVTPSEFIESISSGLVSKA